MKAFLEATKELYTGKGLGSPQWDWRTHRQNLGRKKACLTMPPGPMLGSKSQSEKQKEEESERQNGNDGPAGKYSSRSSKGGGGLVYMLVKRPPCFLSYSFENKLHRQAQSNCIWVWSGFCLGLPKKKKTLKKRTTDSPCVAPCYKSGQKAVKNNKENRWERKWVWTGDTRVMMSYQCCSDVNNPVIVDELKSTRSRTSRHLFLCKLTATVQIHFKAVLLMFNWLFIQYLAFELYQSKWIVLVS